MSQTTSNSSALIRAELWSRQLEELLREQLLEIQYIRILNEFPEGDQFTIPSMGDALVRDYQEDQPITYDAADTGEFNFTITDYISSATYLTNKLMQDSFWSAEMTSRIVPDQLQAIMERFETDCLALANEQTANNPNTINGFDHRYVGTGTNETMSPADFAKANVSLKKAKIPNNLGRVAIVDPTVAYALETTSNIVNVSNNPKYEGIIESGLSPNMRFIRNIYGFDVYESNLIADANETIGGLTTTAGKANVLMSVGNDMLLPFIGAWRQMPEMDGEYNKDFQREEFVTTARYGKKLYRKENLVTILTDTDQV